MNWNNLSEELVRRINGWELSESDGTLRWVDEDGVQQTLTNKGGYPHGWWVDAMKMLKRHADDRDANIIMDRDESGWFIQIYGEDIIGVGEHENLEKAICLALADSLDIDTNEIHTDL